MPIRELIDNNKIKMPRILGMLIYGLSCRKNFTPNKRTSKGKIKLVGLPNKEIISPPRYAPKNPRRFLGGMLGWEV
jgi:hypothetical protein